MSVWTLGINHNTAPLDLRGRFAFAIDQIQPTLQTLRTAPATTPLWNPRWSGWPRPAG
jgi:glutamyl-tRNA reductase